jgi:hypothetical protein
MIHIEMPAGILHNAAIVRMCKLIEEFLDALPGGAGPTDRQAERIREPCQSGNTSREHDFEHLPMSNIGAKQGDGQAMGRTHMIPSARRGDIDGP